MVLGLCFNTHRGHTWCVWISVSGPEAPLQDAGTGHPWGWWWALQATAQTSGQRNSAGHGQRPELCTWIQIWRKCTKHLYIFMMCEQKFKKGRHNKSNSEKKHGEKYFVMLSSYLRLSIQSPSSSSRVPWGCRLWRTGIRPPSVCRWPHR